ncbi:tyrosine decarboxylase isoform X2 [Hyposmocoma kahamanoa]|uniref:tyrosine decarboxylase isoform X2 n=1 Tax=Hyposmocoma kahamanoa TaxID=1477025 RepID=UPI000E6D7536|nr:tyrosine decarboxylase isoform X2 [Hyposmocoma kahamanoa]
MDTEEFRIRGKEMVDYICTYMKTLNKRRVTPSVEPGYLRTALPEDPPLQPEPWEDVMNDVENKIMPGVTHWQHPRFHAYFPSGNGYPSILGDMLSGGIGCIGFSWAASPACTELEIIMLNWMGKAIGLPSGFFALEEGSKGGGVIEGSASECVLVSMLAARANGIKRLKQIFPTENEVTLGLVCFRLVGGPDEKPEQVDDLNKKLLTNINASGKLHMVPANVMDRFVIRFCVVQQHATREDIEIAWEIITDFAAELIEGPDKERELNIQKRLKDRTLAHKRSFFVRMVSDPKIYNPAINTPPPASATPAPTTPASPPAAIAPVALESPTDSEITRQNSWISWPLAFFFQSVDHDPNDLPLRFRHLDTTVRLKSPAGPSRRGSSPSASIERRAPSPSSH